MRTLSNNSTANNNSFIDSARGFSRGIALLAITGACLFLTTSARAQQGASVGYGSEVNITQQRVFGGSENVILEAAPLAAGQGEASFGPFTQNSDGISAALSDSSVDVQSGPLSSWASYDAANKSVMGSGITEDVRVMMNISQNRGTQQDTLSVGNAFSEAEIGGNCGNLTANAFSTIIDGDITINGNTMFLPENPAPNTVIDLESEGLPGVVVILNEQIITGDAQSELSVSVNAIRMTLNVNTFNFQTTGDIVFGASTASISDCVEPTVSDLALSLTGDQSVIQGESLTYSIIVTNNGPDEAVDLLISDPISDDLTINSIIPGPGVQCTQFSQSVFCIADTLAVGDTARAEIMVTTNSTGTISNTADVAAQSTDPNNSNNVETLITEVLSDEADLSINVTASSATVTVGEQLDYLIEIDNIGPGRAEDIVISDTIPEELTIQAVRSNDAVSCSQLGQQITCTVAGMDVFDSVSLTIETTADQAGDVVNTASVVSDNADPDTANNQSSVSGNIGSLSFRG